MHRFPALLAFTILFVIPAAATAQSPAPAATVSASDSTLASEPPPALEPFVARYEVFRDGHALGEAILKLVEVDAPRWQVDLNMAGRGLFRLAGIHAEQSTMFDDTASGFLPIRERTVRKTLFSNKITTGAYDWAKREARWNGDLSEWRQRPIALQRGDLNALLINLAVIRDADPGKTLHYRYVDNGRVKNHTYHVAEDTESVQVDDLGYNAMRVARQPDPDDNEDTTIWVANGVPTPIRMLKRKNGEDKYDLRLIDYTGVE